MFLTTKLKVCSNWKHLLCLLQNARLFSRKGNIFPGTKDRLQNIGSKYRVRNHLEKQIMNYSPSFSVSSFRVGISCTEMCLIIHKHLKRKRDQIKQFYNETKQILTWHSKSCLRHVTWLHSCQVADCSDSECNPDLISFEPCS